MSGGCHPIAKPDVNTAIINMLFSFFCAAVASRPLLSVTVVCVFGVVRRFVLCVVVLCCMMQLAGALLLVGVCGAR